ncbi:MAG TPA: hypothetical protein VF213_09095, partial [Dongiaceae bacterium]
MALSVLSLELNGEDDRRKSADWRDLVHAAFEEGVNAFEIVSPSPALMTGFSEAVEAVRRSLLFVGLRADPSVDAPRFQAWVRQVIAEGRLGYVDMLALKAGATADEELLAAAILLKEADVARRLAVAGSGELVEEDVASDLFDALITPFNMLSGWRDRNLVRQSMERQMGVIGRDPCPQALEALMESAQQKTKPGWFKKPPPLAGAGTYAFLGRTHGWSAEQICLAYALTEPALATVQVPL